MMTPEELDDGLENLIDRAFDNGLDKDTVVGALETILQRVKDGDFDE